MDFEKRDLAQHANLAESLRANGVRPINPEQLTGLMVDYYRLIEANFPEFLAFKDTKNPSATIA